MAIEAEKAVTIRTYLGRRILRKESEPIYKKDVHGTVEKYAEEAPKAYVHVFATVTASPLKLFMEPSLCAKGSSGAWVSLQKLVRRDANAPGREVPYHEGEIDNWRASFVPEMLEGWDVPPEVDVAIRGEAAVDKDGNAMVNAEGDFIWATEPEPFVILDCNEVKLEAPLTDEQIIELALENPVASEIIKTMLAGIAANLKVESVELGDLDETHMAGILNLARMVVGS